MMPLQMITIRIIGLYLISVTVLVKSDCEFMKINRGSTNNIINCKNITLNEKPLLSILPNQEFPKDIIEITLVNSNISLNSKTFENYTKLNTLNLISNNLSTFDISPLPEVRSLNLSHNSLDSLNTTNFQNFHLHFFNASYNRLSTIYCLNVSIKIDLSHNQLNDSCTFAPSIQFINLSYNKIIYLNYMDFNNLTSLINLDLSYNNIIYLSTQLENLRNLIFLNLSHNDIKYIYHNCFEGFDSLIKLDLSYNRIEKIDHGVTNNLKHLRNFDLRYNNIYDLDIAAVCYPMKYLQQLYLEGNVLRDLDVETIDILLKHLTIISLSFSQISCDKLMHYINDLKKFNIEVIKGPTVYQHNVHGILCTPLNVTSLFKDNFEYAEYSIEKVHSLFVVITVFFIIILIMLFAINYYRYKSMRRF